MRLLETITLSELEQRFLDDESYLTRFQNGDLKAYLMGFRREDQIAGIKREFGGYTINSPGAIPFFGVLTGYEKVEIRTVEETS